MPSGSHGPFFLSPIAVGKQGRLGAAHHGQRLARLAVRTLVDLERVGLQVFNFFEGRLQFGIVGGRVGLPARRASVRLVGESVQREDPHVAPGLEAVGINTILLGEEEE